MGSTTDLRLQSWFIPPITTVHMVLSEFVNFQTITWEAKTVYYTVSFCLLSNWRYIHLSGCFSLCFCWWNRIKNPRNGAQFALNYLCMYIIVYLYIKYTYTLCIFTTHYYIITLYIYAYIITLYIYTNYIYSWDDPLHHVPCPFPKTAPQAQWLDGWQATHVARSAAALGLSPGGLKKRRDPALQSVENHGKRVISPFETWWFQPSANADWTWLNHLGKL